MSGTGERIYTGSIGMERDGGSDHDAHKPLSASSRPAKGNQDDFFDSWQTIVYNLDLY